jgi:hypothetical protein
VLTLLIGFLFRKQQLIKPIFGERMNTIVMLVITALSFGLQWYTLNYLPVVDCLPFKKGNNITEKMKMPANYVPDSTVITFVYKKDGKEVEFTALKFPADFNPDTYTFVRRFDKIIKKGKNNEPPIKGFVLTGNTNTDSTAYVLEQSYTVLLFCEKFSTAGTSWKKKFEAVYAAAMVKNIPCFIVTAEPGESVKALAGTAFKDIPVFKCDYKAIQTASRSELTIYLLNKGSVISKYSGQQMSNLKKELQTITVQEKNIPVPIEVLPVDTLNQQQPGSN